ncbi:hypothetical protein INT45_013119 [Circinella minor]|uniref:DNA polymerase n=1 Tax=Circinella minor TaxID=1195481 RepID=A0A8H7VJE8_9FUNG|nr:hypothetical protein INT45_013119 [Circinella minor]
MDWIIKEKTRKDHLEKYIIDIKQYQKKRKIEEENVDNDKQQLKKQHKDESSSEEEEDIEKVSSIPRQVRSWYTIQDTYTQRHGYKVTPRLVIGSRGRTETELIKGESYQTTTTDDNITTEDDDTTDQTNSLSLDDDNDKSVEKLGVYACQRPCNWNPFNKDIVEIFEFLEYARELKGDKINSRSYRIAASIADLLSDGYVQDVELLKVDPEFKVLDMFYNVHGAGSYTAQEWYRRGRRTLKDVLTHEKLSRDQEIGIKYYDDFLKKHVIYIYIYYIIPRTEVEEIANEVSKLLDENFPGSIMTVCGSYRRGKPESGDVDIVMTHKENSVSSKLLVGILDIFKVKGLLVDIITMGSDCKLRDGDDEHLRSDQALCIWRQPGSSTCRRVDFVVSPYENYPVAILAWTGSSHFERSIRLYAKKVMNVKVTSHGLYSRTTQKRLPVKSERDAFEILNLKWLEPSQRNC